MGRFTFYNCPVPPILCRMPVRVRGPGTERLGLPLVLDVPEGWQSQPSASSWWPRDSRTGPRSQGAEDSGFQPQTFQQCPQGACCSRPAQPPPLAPVTAGTGGSPAAPAGLLPSSHRGVQCHHWGCTIGGPEQPKGFSVSGGSFHAQYWCPQRDKKPKDSVHGLELNVGHILPAHVFL